MSHGWFKDVLCRIQCVIILVMFFRDEKLLMQLLMLLLTQCSNVD
jgi:hypothetical protein